MRGHGYCSVGGSIPEAVFRAYYARVNADLQQRAIALGGDVTYLDDEEARLYDETNRGVIGRPWSLWKAKFAATK
jgi:ribulose-5-phosphate 4-epimerase/fuculose-1-phosphate aldolase